MVQEHNIHSKLMSSLSKYKSTIPDIREFDGKPHPITIFKLNPDGSMSFVGIQEDKTYEQNRTPRNEFNTLYKKK
ncbi:hypothetical protein M0R04_08360 [Candidatus Dojkabacteria bacterium]|jgi:hypothetical protein|nr:hypothetical protein [Candidatus Dojkabacteria bacterium]